MSLRQHYDAVAPGSWMVETGATFEQQYGLTFFEYLRQNPDEWALFNLKMEYGLREMVPPKSIGRLALPDHGIVVDVGGGLGYLLEQAKILHPELVTVLCEQQFVCNQARVMRSTLDRFCTEDILTGNLPRADVYLLARVIHDWSDERSLAILRNIREVASTGAQLKIIDIFLDEDRNGPPRALQQQRSMMLLCSSKQHTVTEIKDLLNKSGWGTTSIPTVLSPDMSCITATK